MEKSGDRGAIKIAIQKLVDDITTARQDRKFALTEIGEFMDVDRSVGYSWRTGRSNPSMRGIVGLAFIELTSCDRSKVGSLSDLQVKQKIGAWLEASGHDASKADYLYEKYAHEFSSTLPEKLGLVPEEPFPDDPAVTVAHFTKLAKRLVQENGRPVWELVSNRLAQETAGYRFKEWGLRSERHSVMVYLRGEQNIILKQIKTVVEILTKELTGLGGRRIYFFIEPLPPWRAPVGNSPPHNKEQTSYIELISESVQAIEDQCGKKLEIYLRESKHISQMSLWYFDHFNPTQRMGRLLVPNLGSHLDELLQNAAASEAFEGLQLGHHDILWSLGSVTITRDQAFDFFTDQGVDIIPESGALIAKANKTEHWIDLAACKSQSSDSSE